MTIPDEYGPNSHFRKKMEDWACRSLRLHGFSCKDAADIVQEAYIRVILETEPAVAVKEWAAFLYRYMAYVLLEYSRKERRINPAGSVSLDDMKSETRTVADTLSDRRLNPEEGLIELAERRKWEARQTALLYLARTAIAELTAEGKIAGAERVECFSEVVMRYLKDPETKFDTHRQAVERECKETPPKPTAARWWGLVIERIPSLYELLELLGDNIDGGYIS